MKKIFIGLAATLCLAGLAFCAPQPAPAGKKGANAKQGAGAKQGAAEKKEEAPKSEEAAKQDEGRLVFDSSRCWMCHAIEGHGNKKTPLDGVGTRLTSDQIRKWIVSPKEMKPGTVMGSFSGLSKGDLDALVGYLSGLKQKSK